MKKHEHVLPHKDKWAVKSATEKIADKLFSTKGEAIEYAKKLAIKNKVCLAIHDHEGKFQKFECSPKIKNQHVVKKGNMWAVVEEDSEKISRMFETKGAAMAHAYKLATDHQVCMVVHDHDGKFDSFTCPPDSGPGFIEVVRMATET